MNTTTKIRPLRQRLANFTVRVLYRLRFFPFTLLYVLFTALHYVVQSRGGRIHVRAGNVSGGATSLPRNVMVWLDRNLTVPPGDLVNVYLRLPREGSGTSLQDVFSVMLTYPTIGVINFYWDWSSTADDLRLVQAKRNPNDLEVSPPPYDELGASSITSLEEFLQADHVEIVLPVAAARDAQTLLKRLAGGAYAVCLNLPAELGPLPDALARARPDVRFFDLSPAPLPVGSAANIQSFFGHGLTLHERMAIVQAADAYVGSFDELGCAAQMSSRPAVLLGGAGGDQPDRISRSEVALWFPGATDPLAMAEAALQFLSRHSPVAGKT